MVFVIDDDAFCLERSCEFFSRRVGQPLTLNFRVADPLLIKGPGLDSTSFTACLLSLFVRCPKLARAPAGAQTTIDMDTIHSP
jgi:hypothetical protein